MADGKEMLEEGEVVDDAAGADGAHSATQASKRAKRGAACSEEGGGSGKAGKDKGKGRAGLTAPPNGYVCKACHREGHWLEQCKLYQSYRSGPPPPGYVCVRCQQAGHWVHNCVATTGKWRESSAQRDQRSEEEQGGPVVVGLDAADIGEEIAENLEEDAPEVVQLVCQCVQLLGEEACRQLVVQTWQVENSGGMLTLDGSQRRRTPGGVFFWLVKQKATPQERGRLFPARPRSSSSAPDPTATAPPTPVADMPCEPEALS